MSDEQNRREDQVTVIGQVVNTAVDDVLDEVDCTDPQRDFANLLVNVIMTRFERPHATVREIIETNYENDPDTVIGWAHGHD